MQLTPTTISFVAPLALSTLSACATVPSGQAGVLLRSSGVDRESSTEGVNFVGPWGTMETYDLRAQTQSEDLEALSADGAMLDARASVMTFHPVAEEVVALARETGPDYCQVLVKPVVRSTLRRVLAAFRADELDTPRIGLAEKQVTALSAERLRAHHIVFDSISLRTLRIAPSSGAYKAILDTSVKEQEAIAARQLPELARLRAEGLRADARGIAESHTLIAPTLTPEVLNDAENRACSRLLTAPSTMVEVHLTPQPYFLEVQP